MWVCLSLSFSCSTTVCDINVFFVFYGNFFDFVRFLSAKVNKKRLKVESDDSNRSRERRVSVSCFEKFGLSF